MDEKEYALKKLSFDNFEEMGGNSLLLNIIETMNEISIGKLIKNDNLVDFKDVSFSQENNKIVIEILMDYFDCGDLRSKFNLIIKGLINEKYKNNAFFKESEVINYLKQIVNAVKELHKNNM
jgi:serine/threonine protein kinase